MISVQNISKTFSNGTKALINISLEINERDFIILCGPNGSGKSVLIKHLNGSLQPTSGKIILYGKEIKTD